jgi:hypothetical protein
MPGSAVVECFNRQPQVAQAGAIARDHVGACHRRGVRAGLGRHVHDEARIHPIEDAIGGCGGNQLAAQTVMGDAARKALAPATREIAFEFAGQVRIVGNVCFGKRLVERDLAIGKQYRQLRARKPKPTDHALLNIGIARQELQGAIELPVALEHPE